MLPVDLTLIFPPGHETTTGQEVQLTTGTTITVHYKHRTSHPLSMVPPYIPSFPGCREGKRVVREWDGSSTEVHGSCQLSILIRIRLDDSTVKLKSQIGLPKSTHQWAGNLFLRLEMINSSTFLSVSVTRSAAEDFMSTFLSRCKASQATWKWQDNT